MLKGPPSENHLMRLYFELANRGASCSGAKRNWPYQPKSKEELFVLGAEMSRHDPRLLGILVEYLIKHWKELSPQKIRDFYPTLSTPQAVAVIAEFGKAASKDAELIFFLEYLQRGLAPVPFQLYFKNIYSPGGKLTERAVQESLKQYKKWGFLAREAPTVDVYQKKTVGHMDRDSRLNLLNRLFEQKKILSLKDYLEGLHQTTSRQQALVDLQSVARLKNSARGRGAKWVLKKSKSLG